MARKSKVEVRPVYDWLPGQEGKSLIYVGKKPTAKDPAIGRTLIKKGTREDPLCQMMWLGILEGAAMDEAVRVCPAPPEGWTPPKKYLN